MTKGNSLSVIPDKRYSGLEKWYLSWLITKRSVVRIHHPQQKLKFISIFTEMDKKILERLSIEFKLPEHIIEKIVRHPYKFQLDMMKSGKLKPFRHPYFGVFAVKPYRLKYVTDKRNANKP